MLYREIIAVCSHIHTKLINTLCGHPQSDQCSGRPPILLLRHQFQYPPIFAKDFQEIRFLQVSPPTSGTHCSLTFCVYTSHSYFVLTTQYLQGNTNIWRRHAMVNKRTLSTHVLQPLAPRSQDDKTLPNTVGCRMLTVGNSLTANQTTWRHCLGCRSVPRSREALFRHGLQCSQQNQVMAQRLTTVSVANMRCGKGGGGYWLDRPGSG